MLCRIFQKSGLGPPNGDRYAPFLEEEWTDDAALMVPGGEADDDLANGDETRVHGNDIVHVLFCSLTCKFDIKSLRFLNVVCYCPTSARHSLICLYINI